MEVIIKKLQRNFKVTNTTTDVKKLYETRFLITPKCPRIKKVCIFFKISFMCKKLIFC